MIITLIGMSNTGKSHWSKRLAGQGFEHISADDLIESKLDRELTPLGYKGIADVGRWMGHPYAEQYPATSRRYLELEQAVMQGILDLLPAPGRDVVVDTTGSFIYMPPEILEPYRRSTTIVYFHTPESAHADMAKQFFAEPKPLIWGNSYSKKSAESDDEALARCYPQLLIDRTAKYQKLAHARLDYDQLRSADMTAPKIIDHARRVKVEVG